MKYCVLDERNRLLCVGETAKLAFMNYIEDNFDVLGFEELVTVGKKIVPCSDVVYFLYTDGADYVPAVYNRGTNYVDLP